MERERIGREIERERERKMEGIPTLSLAMQWRSYTRAYQGTGPGKICLCPGKTPE